jgi:imidazolonepropionase-like amidohydrolase
MSNLFAALVLTGGTIVGPKTDIRNAVVTIRDGKIVAAGPQKRTAIPGDARVIDVRAVRTLSPASTTSSQD